MTKNYKFTICYDGSRYYGWEHQPDRDTIQGRLENVLSRLCGEEIKVIGAGRTDAGVHARAMTANAVFDTELDPDELRDYMNRYLPDDIAVCEGCPRCRGSGPGRVDGARCGPCRQQPRFPERPVQV